MIADLQLYLTLALAGLAAVGLLAAAALRGWREWLAYKRLELESVRESARTPSPGQRIEIADLKERIRKLEAIAAGLEY